MQFLLFCIILINVPSPNIATRISNEDLQEWEQFKSHYAKAYHGKDKEDLRKHIFVENLHYIREHNTRYANEEESFSVKVNQFADLTNEEFRKIMNGYKSGIKPRSKYKVKKPGTTNLPLSVDWRTEGAVTKVKNQGYCGSCWAFSTTGSLEGQLYWKTGSLVSLSEQNLLDCSELYGNEGCSGGVMDFAFKYVVKNKGVEPEEEYEYKGKKGNCSYRHTKRLAAASTFVDLPKGNEYELMEAVATVGPVSVAIDACDIGLQFYSYGIFKSQECSRTRLDHAVLVVGYGVKSGNWLWDGDYWIVKNSWGTSWGMDGYVWIARNMNNMCGIATEASYPILKTDQTIHSFLADSL